MIFFIWLMIIALIIILYFPRDSSEVAYVKSDVDGNLYLVRNLPDKQRAADLLATLKKSLDAVAQKEQLTEQIKTTQLAERSTTHIYTSYTVNKGAKMVFCLRQKDDSFVDQNTLLFVGLHELAHVKTKSKDPLTGGHNKEFWDNFDKILLTAHKMGIYKYIDYHESPVEYCREYIKNNPLTKYMK